MKQNTTPTPLLSLSLSSIVEKMHSILNLHGSYGLPLCVSGITHRLTLTKEMADHDRRREAMRKNRSHITGRLQANQEMGIHRNHERVLGEIKEGDVDRDLDADLSCSSLAAKAA